MLGFSFQTLEKLMFGFSYWKTEDKGCIFLSSQLCFAARHAILETKDALVFIIQMLRS
jgi:hypothetical protein